ncbi:transmembrane protein 154-like isoform X1 [Carassius gibelio]|uniref:transmembrane protein 154-like isoform X1 n=1 Tax=Carassius gibelio TaxID=101364 RepID=UPI002277889E|nr:transmembrane protein 154-like isoform X1 [Carassius gibelio]
MSLGHRFHRGLWEMNLILFLLLALTASWTGLVQCEDDKNTTENLLDSAGSGDDGSQNPLPTTKNEEEKQTTEANPVADTDDLNPVIVPLVLTLVILTVIVCVVMIYCRWRIKDAEDPYLDHEDHGKVPMPMFDDDIPSVMELEMEDIENWMAKDGGKKVDTGQI